MKELEGYILARITRQKIEIIDHPRKRQADLRWLIKRKTRTSTSGKRGNGARLA
jgi:hypothetical protein